jgi:predicted HicB family RNase H-like nuclease
MNELKYKGYRGSVEYSARDDCLFGKIIGIRSSVSYEGESVAEIAGAFREAVDDYLDFCEERGVEPQREYSGVFQVRTTPDVHKRLSEIASGRGTSLNAVVSEALKETVHA